MNTVPKRLIRLVPNFELNKKLYDLGFRFDDEDMVVWWWYKIKENNEISYDIIHEPNPCFRGELKKLFPAYHIGILGEALSGLEVFKNLHGETRLPVGANTQCEMLINVIQTDIPTEEWKEKWIKGESQ